MIITFVEGATCTPDRASVADLPPQKFLDALVAMPSQLAATEADKLDGSGFILARYRDGSRSKAASHLDPAATTELLCFDVDAMTLDEVRDALPTWAKVDGAAYSTWKHTSEAPRLRLLVRLDQPISVVDGGVFRHCYLAAAAALGLRFDSQAAAAANLYFLPQHKPESNGAAQRHRFRGGALSVAGLLAMEVAAAVGGAAGGGAGGGDGAAMERPDKGELKQLAARLKKRRADVERQGGRALAAVLRCEPYAMPGHVYEQTKHVAWAVATVLPELDAGWFRDTWLVPVWEKMWPGEPLAPASRDWGNAWDSAARALRESRHQRAAERDAVAPAPGGELTTAQTDRLSPFAGALIVIHGAGYYVLDARAAEYSGAVKAAAVAPRARDLLGGVRGVFVTEPRENGRPVAKGATQLTLEYGTVADSVHYWARVPEDKQAWDVGTRSLHIRAYTWNHWEPVEHAIVDDLLRTMAGGKYAGLEGVLSKWCDLGQALPALTLVGPPGTWKSRTAQTLSRFWGDRDAPTACRAEQVLRRFSAPLLQNPVIWSDEALATGEGGQEIPEVYRESISETAHQVEAKGVDPVILHSATRHIIAVNDIGKVFSGEISGDAVRATLDRFLVLDIAGPAMADFEARWAGSREMARLREGSSMLEHVAWLGENRLAPSQGRFWVAGHTDPDVLTRARFADDTLNLALQVAVDALLSEARTSQGGSDPDRTPLTGADPGVLRMSPARIVKLWADAPATKGSKRGAPTPTWVGRALAQAGFRADPLEQARKNKFKSWVLNKDTFVAWLGVSDLYAAEDLERAILTIWGSKMALSK